MVRLLVSVPVNLNEPFDKKILEIHFQKLVVLYEHTAKLIVLIAKVAIPATFLLLFHSFVGRCTVRWCYFSDFAVVCNDQEEKWAKRVPFLYHAVQMAFQILNLNFSSPNDGWLWSNSGGLATINSNKNVMCVRSGTDSVLFCSPRR